MGTRKMGRLEIVFAKIGRGFLYISAGSFVLAILSICFGAIITCAMMFPAYIDMASLPEARNQASEMESLWCWPMLIFMGIWWIAMIFGGLCGGYKDIDKKST